MFMFQVLGTVWKTVRNRAVSKMTKKKMSSLLHSESWEVKEPLAARAPGMI